MAQHQSPEVLEYHTPDPTRRKWSPILGAVVGATIGAAVMVGLLSMAIADGPVFPLTLAFAPIWIPVELSSTVQPHLIAFLLLGGPGLYASYGALAALPRRRWSITVVAMIHALCFLLVCHLRDVWSLL